MEPVITGVLETSLYVEDLDRSSAFYRDLFEFEVLVSDARMQALAVAAKQVLLLFRRGASLTPGVIPGGMIPPHDGNGALHLAFSIPKETLKAWGRRLEDRRIEVESRVEWPRGGSSIYFRDPDGHLVELITPGCWTIY